MDTIEYLRDLAARLMHIPVAFGVDQGDTVQLAAIIDAINDLDSDAFNVMQNATHYDS